jgi:hypothetical protein
MFKHILAIAVATITLIYAPIVYARQWVLVGNNRTHQVYIDVDSIKGEGNTRTFWDRDISSEEVYPSGYLRSSRPYSSATSLVFVDCSSNKLGLLEGIYYDRNGEVIGSFDDSSLGTPQQLVNVVPDSVGEAELNYVCGLRSDVTTDRSFSSSRSAYSTSLSREQAVSIVNQWLQIKHQIFAPPFSLNSIDSITTGTLHRDLTSASSPVNWLKNNNAYYRFGTQRIDSVNSFEPSTNYATLEVTVTEERTLFVNGQVNPSESGVTTFNVRYFLARTNGTWKISDYRVLK